MKSSGQGPLVVNIIFKYCSTSVLRVLFLREDGKELFCHIFILGGILIEGGCPLLATPINGYKLRDTSFCDATANIYDEMLSNIFISTIAKPHVQKVKRLLFSYAESRQSGILWMLMLKFLVWLLQTGNQSRVSWFFSGQYSDTYFDHINFANISKN